MDAWIKITCLLFILLFAILYIYFKKTLLSYQDDDLVLIHPFFPKKQFSDIAKYCKTLDSKLENDSRVKSRKTYMCDAKTDASLYYMIYSSHLFQQMRKILKKDTIFASEFPIEYRKYETGSEGMPWHQDKPLYNQPYYECVLTLENNSDSIFEFNVDDTIHSVEPKPNSLVLVKPSSIYHRVSPLEKGERTILKFIFLLNENNEKSDDYEFESKV